LHFIELKLCEKVGAVLQECNKLCNCGSSHLATVWMQSKIFDRILDGDVSVFSQAKSYIVRTFFEKNRNELAVSSEKEMLYDDVLFWFGYLITYWCLELKETPTNIMRNYDVSEILYSYDVLHTISIKEAITKIKEDSYGKN